MAGRPAGWEVGFISSKTRYTLKIQNPHQYRAFSLMQPSELAYLLNHRSWQNRQERLNRFTNNGDMTETANVTLSGSE